MGTFTGLQGTVLGPLTTSWVAPSFCTAHVLPCSTCSEGFRGQSCVVGTDGKASEQDNSGTPVHPFVGWGFYSPGTGCPTGYSAACTARYGKGPEWKIQFDLQEGETAVGCCPTGFDCTNRNGNTCIQIAGTQTGESVVVQTGTCSGTELANIRAATFPDKITITTTRTDDGEKSTEKEIVRRDVTLLAPMIQINYQSSDLLPTETDRTSTIRSTTGSSPGGTETGQERPQDLGDDTTPGISGEKIGIIVGVTVGGLLAVAGAAWFIWHFSYKR
ncbi:uncharacterized protein F5Z01DRAFT_688251 [Emericellopsis atlantica]|uniref:Uncharacterized protein n=1 Tax=Emericellopsis atlantica TaxID=2614577 RepID=A0A9P8CQ63_9HYPO|nr:uncharacterized protein F5Z01DRAFT_688251 [Emericellopsis atlantica]KAG9253426.1 hypothetical protein F5Z01DRAFT_688251 [Emericellopsis atlantica]